MVDNLLHFQNDPADYATGVAFNAATSAAMMKVGQLGRGAPSGKTGVQANKIKGHAFRDKIAGLLEKDGFEVRTEVQKKTPVRSPKNRYRGQEERQGSWWIGNEKGSMRPLQSFAASKGDVPT
jgi:hypothetical protein